MCILNEMSSPFTIPEVLLADFKSVSTGGNGVCEGVEVNVGVVKSPVMVMVAVGVSVGVLVPVIAGVMVNVDVPNTVIVGDAVQVFVKVGEPV